MRPPERLGALKQDSLDDRRPIVGCPLHCPHVNGRRHWEVIRWRLGGWGLHMARAEGVTVSSDSVTAIVSKPSAVIAMRVKVETQVSGRFCDNIR
jgi:hypothetical protein